MPRRAIHAPYPFPANRVRDSVGTPWGRRNSLSNQSHDRFDVRRAREQVDGGDLREDVAPARKERHVARERFGVAGDIDDLRDLLL